MSSRPFFWFLPDPDAKAAETLRPYKRHEGSYELHRDPEDTEITYIEPGGDSYTLEFFECEEKLRVLLRLDEVDVNTILDRLWNFYHVRFDVDTPEIVEILR